MTPEQFAYWLQGFCEAHGEPPTEEQWRQIKDHLSKVTPAYFPPGRFVPMDPPPSFWDKVIC